MLIEIICQKRIVSNVILAFLDHLKPKTFFIGQPWWPTYRATLFQNLWIRPWLLATETFKSKIGVSPEQMNDIFHFVERPYNLRSGYTLERKRDHAVYHASESLSSLAPKLCYLLLNSIKNSASLKDFKIKINTQAFERCSCRYTRNMLREEDLFWSFHRFSAFGFGFVIFLLYIF